MPRTLLHYDFARRRLWIAGQRCHHGATGALMAATGACGHATGALTTPTLAALLVSGAALMAHDWKDRQIWFQRGWQNQP